MEGVVAFWRRHLADAPPVMELITDHPRQAGVTDKREAGQVYMTFHRSIPQALGAMGRSCGGSITNALLVAFQVLLARYSRATDVVVGVRLSNGEAIPMRLELPAGGGLDQLGPPAFNDVLAQAVATHTEALHHATLPWARLLPEVCSDKTDGSYHPVFQCLFSCPDLSGSRTPPATPSGMNSPTFARRQKKENKAVDFDLELHFDRAFDALSADNVSGMLLYRKALFDHLTMQRFAEHFKTLLTELTARPSSPWYEVPLMSNEERTLVLDTLNRTSAPYPDESCIHDLFELQAAENPSRPCLWYEDAAGVWVHVTYEGVYSRAMHVAGQLSSHGVGPDVPVPLLLERSLWQLVAIYGVLLAGGCYVPIDVDYPSDRIHVMLDDCKAQQMLTDSKSLQLVPTGWSGRSWAVDDLCVSAPTVCAGDVGPRRRRKLRQSPDTNVYVFYTSGTTGKPKGVEVTHRGLVKRAQWLQDFYPMGADDRMIYKTPYTFGISEWELFWPLPYGFQLVICKEGGQKNPEYLLETTVKLTVTCCTYVPSMLAILIEHMTSEQKNYTTDMKHVICCGEALPIETCVRFFEVFDPDITRLHNFYGPTEADMTYWECPKLNPGDEEVTLTKIPIGKPMYNVKVYILDAWGHPVPAGVPGELHFGGVTTARGYLGLPELTREKFIPCPFAKGRDCDRMYRTGDCARWLPDLSNLEFLGRIDNQVKLRGFRIELGEVESVLGQCDGVSKAAVIVHGKGATAKLVAYVEPAMLDVGVLRKGLRAKVPQYMVPDIIMTLDRMPLTSRGKLDRKALPEPRMAAPTTSGGAGGAMRRAETETERIVESIWQEVLEPTGRARTAPIDIGANFLSLGGNSLLAGRVTTKIRQQTKATIPSTAMYQHPTIERIAALCEQYKAPEKPAGDVIGGNANKPWGGRSGSSPAVIAGHILGLIMDSFASTAAFLPGYMYVFTVYLEHGRMAAMMVLPVVMAATILTITLYSIAMKWLVLGRTLPGEYPVWGGFYIRWWFVGNLTRSTIKILAPLIGGTWLFNAYLRLLGARIGNRVVIDTEDIMDPEHMTIDHDVEVCRKATIICHAVENGILSIWPVHIKHHAIIEPVGWVTPGTVVDPGYLVGPLSTTGGVGETKFGGPAVMARKGPSMAQEFVRTCVCTPLIICFEALCFLPAIFCLEWLWLHGLSGIQNENWRYIVFYLFLPWIDKLVIAEAFFLGTALFKWICIGRFQPGRRTHSFFHELARWILERLTHNTQFKFATQPWINTELLAIKYRIMGVRMGFKCQTDFFDILEFDLLTVGADSVFGSNVCIAPSDHIESRRVVMQRGSQVLDHSTLMPGCVVGHHALCGSSTVGSKFYKFPPLSISTGNQGGRPVQLRVLQGEPDSAESLSHLPPGEKKMAMSALRAHRSNCTWGMFNFFNIGIVMLIAPLPAFADLITVLLWMWLDSLKMFSESNPYANILSWVVTIAITPPCYFVVQVLEALLFIIFKWVVIGKYKEGNFAFYGHYHRKWVIMMAVKEAIGKLLAEIQGTIFTAWFFRAMGSNVGKDVCIFGYGLEYDLFTAGDYTSVGIKCDVTCHTVENMVIKLASTRIDQNVTMRAGALIQPGGAARCGSVILENSQVLKGGQAEENTVYRGLPAEPVQRVRAELEGPRRLLSYDHAGPPEGAPAKNKGMERRHRMLLIVAIAFALWCLSGSGLGGSKAVDNVDQVTVTLPDGTVRGRRTQHGVIFLGIPYAQPPVGPLRWAPPAPVERWQGVIEATRRRDGCISMGGGGSEDCLYLDVTLPEAPADGTTLFPVVYWLPGGCFAESWVPGYDGRALMRASPNTIVVTASHRIGALGFLPSLAEGANGTNAGANFGILDQRAVLDWIVRNIKQFRGDPQRVTLFGQGSGAAAVVAHLVMPRSWGLFQGAVVQSASAAQLVARSQHAAAGERKNLEQHLGCKNQDVARCLQRASAHAIGAVKSDGIGAHSSACAGQVLAQDACQWGPSVDGVELVDHPWRLLEQGRVAGVPVLVGWRADDGSRGLAADHAPGHSLGHAAAHHHPRPNGTGPAAPPSAPGAAAPPSAPGSPAGPASAGHHGEHDAASAGSALDGEHEREGHALYKQAQQQQPGATHWLATTAARTDLLQGCPGRRVAHALATRRTRRSRRHSVRLYVGEPGSPLSHLWFQRWGRHEADVPAQVPPKAAQYFAAFFANHDAAAPVSGLPQWLPVTADGTRVMRISATGEPPPAMADFPTPQPCDFWDKHWGRFAECDRDEARPVARDPGPVHHDAAASTTP
eukprot:TRINITY_DN15855_c0_g2_i1.p1 TRINITY_DN15855_c0_g2~~TRINITY_DN15855_c0_g2_i1.p1  ORF type:complete len:2367 (+),score=707.90 TRINITY_DN15855_c0_g2_i1:269-7102(+)